MYRCVNWPADESSMTVSRKPRRRSRRLVRNKWTLRKEQIYLDKVSLCIEQLHVMSSNYSALLWGSKEGNQKPLKGGNLFPPENLSPIWEINMGWGRRIQKRALSEEILPRLPWGGGTHRISCNRGTKAKTRAAEVLTFQAPFLFYCRPGLRCSLS